MLFAFVIGLISANYYLFILFLLILFFIKPLKSFLINTMVFILGFCLFSNHQSHIKTQGLQFYHNFFSSFLIKVKDFEQKKNWGRRWRVEILQPIKGEVWLSCYKDCPSMLPGEAWWVQGRLKKMSGFNNPGQSSIWYRMDFRHVIGQLSVSPGRYQKEENIAKWDLLHRVRVWIYQKANLKFSEQQGFAKQIFLTLVLGIGSELSNDDWQMFKDTGTAHLMVVSGAHLSLLMMLIEGLVQHTYRWIPVSIPLKRIASALSLSAGILYAVLSGFGVPVQRALLMKCAMDSKYWFAYRMTSFQAFQLALFLILCWEPHAIWYPGTYLSFIAVGILMLIPRVISSQSWWMTMVTQFFCLVGLSPLTVLWFSSIPLSGMLANFFAIPWVSWCVLPLALSMTIFLNQHILDIFYWSVRLLQIFLKYLHHFQGLNLHLLWPHPLIPWALLLSILIIAILPKWRLVLVCCGLIFALWHLPVKPQKDGEFMVDVLDVGQGLSVLVRTAHHALLYDTGGQLGQKTSTSLVVLPYLQYIRLKNLDTLVLSHPDLDHIAGRKEILTAYPQTQLVVDNPQFYHTGRDCRQIKDWCWEGVCFHFFKKMRHEKKKNNHSCVLQVNNIKYAILLTGDIEKKAEGALISALRNRPETTVLLVPHHGSRTSSTEAFLKAVKAKLAIVSVALYNSYHLPHPTIQKRYQDFQIPWVTTAEEGMIQVRFFNHYWRYLTYSKEIFR
ncbi:MAG: competence protein ComEC [Pseudomonadota bacterium]|nr:competence protein ComEC [Pseudomonadota bacterium]